jgi:hypothetical protein
MNYLVFEQENNTTYGIATQSMKQFALYVEKGPHRTICKAGIVIS